MVEWSWEPGSYDTKLLVKSSGLRPLDFLCTLAEGIICKDSHYEILSAVKQEVTISLSNQLFDVTIPHGETGTFRLEDTYRDVYTFPYPVEYFKVISATQSNQVWNAMPEGTVYQNDFDVLYTSSSGSMSTSGTYKMDGNYSVYCRLEWKKDDHKFRFRYYGNAYVSRNNNRVTETSKAWGVGFSSTVQGTLVLEVKYQ